MATKHCQIHTAPGESIFDFILFVSAKISRCNCCYCRMNDRELKFARIVMFAVEEINRDPQILPGVTLGYRLYNGCGSENLIRAAVEAVNSDEFKDCTGQIQALLGHSSSGVSKDINLILSSLSIPQVRQQHSTSVCRVVIVLFNMQLLQTEKLVLKNIKIDLRYTVICLCK